MAVRKVSAGTDENGAELFDYEFGDEVDGVFIPIQRKTGSYVDALVKTGKDQAEQAKSRSKSA